ncbi:esterase-like activity of phytase family protein [Kiloniella laminariae]|uniref:esterase-like activity of phytase family protein n=1 Tax=Kiloniella laminariae TaxID=454162 RepID=UPI000368A1A1|nr:esterase-like activity of phytase family protein [Kiloniella laminariae]
MIQRALYVAAFLAGIITVYIAYQDRNLAVLQSVSIPLQIEAVATPLTHPDTPQHDQLIWRGGIKMTSPHPRFGGLSGLEISPDGRGILAITDKGFWFKGRLGYSSDGNLLNLSRGILSSLHDTAGGALTRKKDRDSESLAMSENGAVYVSFERKHRILLYESPLATKAEAIPFPEALEDAGKNRGIEAMTELPGGCLLVLAERQQPDGLLEAYLWDQESWQSLTLQANSKGLLPTGLAMTPDGDLLLLERSFSFLGGFASSLRIFPAEEIRPGYIMKGRVLANFDGEQAMDNLEGISSRRGEKGETLVYLLSDDNLSMAQQTLLVMFELREQEKPAGLRSAGCLKNGSAYSAALETKAF